MRTSKLMAVALLAASVAVPAVASPGEPASPSAGPGRSASWVPEPGAAPAPATAAERGAFSVLARAAGPDDGDDHLVVRLAQASDIGMDPAGARVVGRTSAGRAWLIPVPGGLCLALEDERDDSIGTSCEAGTDVVARGITLGDGQHVYGVAPDGASSIVVRRAGQDAATIALGSSRLYTLPSQDATVTVGGTSFDISG
jgi:hypothetical protein